MTRLEILARWAAGLELSDAPPRVVERLRLQAASTLAAGLAGRTSRELAPLAAAARHDGVGPLLPGFAQDGFDEASAVAIGAAAASVDSYDDWLLCARPGPAAVWTAWTVGASREAGWDEVLRVQLAVDEVLGRLGGLLLAGSLGGRPWSWQHAVGAALAVGLLRGLEPGPLADAMALAFLQSPVVERGALHGPGRTAVVAAAVRAGRRAALLAEAGLRGPRDLLDDGSPHLEAHGGGRPLPAWISGLGAVWLTDTLSVGLWACSPLLAGVVEAVDRVAAEVEEETGARPRAADVLRVDVEAALVTCAAERLGGGGRGPSPGAARYGAAEAIRLLLDGGGLSPSEHRAGPSDEDDGPSPFAERVHVHHDWHLTLAFWEAFRASLGEGLLGGLGLRTVARLVATRADLAWAELPLALASDRLHGVGRSPAVRELPGELVEDPGAALAKGASLLADWATRRLERLVLGPALGAVVKRVSEEPEGEATAGLEAADPTAAALPMPARVRVLLHGGRVREAEVTHVAGSPARRIDDTRARVAVKAEASVVGLPRAEAARWSELFAALVGPADAPLPGAGPGWVLRSGRAAR